MQIPVAVDEQIEGIVCLEHRPIHGD